MFWCFFFFFFWEESFTWDYFFYSGSRALFTGPIGTSFQKRKKNFKIRFHNTIHTFKNYFITIFSVFSKISSIQTGPYFVSNRSSFLSTKKETGSYPILSCFGVLHSKKDCLPTIKVKHIDNVASPWFLFASCETATTLEIKFLYSLSFVRFIYLIFFFFFLYIQYLDFIKILLYYLCNFHIFFPICEWEFSLVFHCCGHRPKVEPCKSLIIFSCVVVSILLSTL